MSVALAHYPRGVSTVNLDHYKKLYLVKIHKTSDHGVPSPSGYTYNTVPNLRLKEYCRRERVENQEVFCEIVSSRDVRQATLKIL